MHAGQRFYLDVRQDVLRRHDPFAKIMRAAEGLGSGQVLIVINDFEPRLLYKALRERGFTYTTEPNADGGWRIFIHKTVNPRSTFAK